MSRLQDELITVDNEARRQFLQSKADAERASLIAILEEHDLPRPNKSVETCTLCYLHSWVTQVAHEAGLVNRAFCRAQLGL